MSLKSLLDAALKTAMKEKDTQKTTTIRGLRAVIKNKEIEMKSDLDDAGILKLIAMLVKQRQDSIQMYADGGRDDLREKEEAEMKILQEYLPEQLADEKLVQIVADTITELGASSPKEMGQVMKAVLAKVAGQADGKRVSQLVQEKLNN